jgi:hypothetical protein
VHKRIISAVKKVRFVSDRMSYIIPRGPWCHFIVLNVHAPTEDKTNDVKDSFYEELERFDLKKLNIVEDEEQFRVEVSIGVQLWNIWTQTWKLIVPGKRLERI